MALSPTDTSLGSPFSDRLAQESLGSPFADRLSAESLGSPFSDQLAPGAAEDDTPGILQTVGSNFLRGIAGIFTDVAFLGDLATRALGANTNFEAFLNEFIENKLPVDPDAGFFAGTLPQAAGSLVTFAVPGFAVGARALRAGKTVAQAAKASRLAGGAVGVVGGVATGFRESQAADNDSDAKLFFSVLANAGLGATEALPIGRAFTRLNRATGGATETALRRVLGDRLGIAGADVVASALQGALEEGAQELIQSQGSTAAAKILFGVERDFLSPEDLEGALAGVILGGGLSGAARAFGGPPAVEAEVEAAVDVEGVPVEPETVGIEGAEIAPEGEAGTLTEGIQRAAAEEQARIEAEATEGGPTLGQQETIPAAEEEIAAPEEVVGAPGRALEVQPTPEVAEGVVSPGGVEPESGATPEIAGRPVVIGSVVPPGSDVAQDPDLVAGDRVPVADSTPREDRDARTAHRPDPDGPPSSDLEATGVQDIYSNPEFFVADIKSAAGRESVAAIKAIRGQPDALITIYRSGPVNELRDGDWVSLSETYAREAGMHPTDSAKDSPVFAFEVRAQDVKWAQDSLEEFGYFPGEQAAAAESTTAPAPKTEPGALIVTPEAAVKATKAKTTPSPDAGRPAEQTITPTTADTVREIEVARKADITAIPQEEFSLRKEAIHEMRETIGLAPEEGVTQESRRQWLDEAQAKNIPQKAVEIINEVLASPRALTKIEVAGINQRLTEVSTEIQKMEANLLNLTDPVDISQASKLYNLLETERDAIIEGRVVFGAEASRSFSALGITLDKSFNLVSAQSRAVAAKGKALSAKEKGDLKTNMKDYQDLQRQVVQLETELRNERAAGFIKARMSGKQLSKMTPAQRSADLKTLTAKLKELAAKGCDR